MAMDPLKMVSKETKTCRVECLDQIGTHTHTHTDGMN